MRPNHTYRGNPGWSGGKNWDQSDPRVNPHVKRYKKTATTRYNRYRPHQGIKERHRRMDQMGEGRLRPESGAHIW